MGNDLFIRKATRIHLKQISEIFLEESTKKPYLQEWGKRTSLEKIVELFKKGDIYLAIENGNLVGFVACHSRYEGKDVFIDEFWVKSSHQGKGVGSALVRFIENTYKNKHALSITLISDKTARAFRFYKKLGYKETKQYVLMEKKLKYA